MRSVPAAHRSLRLAAAIALSTTSAFGPMLAPVAHAAPSPSPAPSPVSASKALGDFAGTTTIPLECNGRGPAAGCVLPATARRPTDGESFQRTSRAPVRNIFQNKVWWFGKPNPTPPARVRGAGPVLTFTPLDWIPGFLQPLWGFFTQNRNFEACILGATLMIGPYGTKTVSLNRGCA